jgi:hypothetical protein
VPYLERVDRVGIEDSRLIASYLDSLDRNPSIVAPFDLENWESGRLETYARSMVDGISVWLREMRPPENERSLTMQGHEALLAGRLADFWENEVTAHLMNGPLILSKLFLHSGLDFATFGRMDEFTRGRPQFAKWAAQMRQTPSLTATAPFRGD